VVAFFFIFRIIFLKSLFLFSSYKIITCAGFHSQRSHACEIPNYTLAPHPSFTIPWASALPLPSQESQISPTSQFFPQRPKKGETCPASCTEEKQSMYLNVFLPPHLGGKLSFQNHLAKQDPLLPRNPKSWLKLGPSSLV
jgi:hypothetical protein